MLLTLLWLFPAAGALIVWALPSRGAARAAAFAWAVLLLLYSAALLVPFQAQDGVLRLQEQGTCGAFGIRYHMGVDALALSLCWLTTLLSVFAMLGTWNMDAPPGYWASLLALESALLGVFASQSLFYFYVFWDLALIPMFFMIGLWGSEGARRAALKFALYTFLGGLFLLLGIVALAVSHHGATGNWSWDWAALAATPAGRGAGRWIFLAMAAGFAVKLPVFPLHNWLPDAHTQAPAAGSVMLAGVMLKMGAYGFLRLFSVFPEWSVRFWPLFGALGAINILYGALCAMAQGDLKRLVAFTSVSHLGFCLLGFFSFTPQGLSGGALQMLNHGLSTGGLFLLVGMMYERAHTRRLADFGDLAASAPRLAFFFAVLLLASIGLPGLNGFVGEALSVIGMARSCWGLAALGAFGAVLAAAYGLPAYQRVFWSPAGPGSASARVTDLNARESALMGALAALILLLGLYPGPLLAFLEPALAPLAR